MRTIPGVLAITAAALLGGASIASANVHPACTPTGTVLTLSGFPKDRTTKVDWSIDGITSGVAYVRGTSTVEVALPTLAPWTEVTARIRWWTGPRDTDEVRTHVRCDGPPPVQPEEPAKPVDPVPPTAPEPPAKPTPEVLIPVLPGPDNPCSARMRNVYRVKAGPKWVREAIERGCVATRKVKRCPKGTTRITIRPGVAGKPGPRRTVCLRFVGRRTAPQVAG